MQYNYVISAGAFMKIRQFYVNVAKKYRHTYSFEDLERNVHHAVFDCYYIENTLHRRMPTIKRWEGYFMANTEKWYYAYKIEGDTITITDACHAQNMHED